MTTIPAAVAQIIAQPAPVVILDTCNLLDLFRCDKVGQKPRVPAEEIRIASVLLAFAIARPAAAHLVVPELVPGEFTDHANKTEGKFDEWLKEQDENQAWLAEASPWVGTSLPNPPAVRPFGLHAGFRRLADDLLAQAVVLDRDQASLNRAVERLIAKRRPSHKKEIKDAINLEQCLELCLQLRDGGFQRPAVFVSSNKNDYAMPSPGSRLHVNLRARFAVVSLEYYPSLRSAVGALRARRELP